MHDVGPFLRFVCSILCSSLYRLAYIVDHSTEFPQQNVQSTAAPSHASPGITAGVAGAASAIAATTAATLASGATTAMNKASEVYNNPSAYVPAALAGSTTTTSTSLPSQEYEGQKPFEHTDGAGALPGSIHEQSVAVPPDARG